MEVFNPNPTIFVPTRTNKSSQFASPHSLWLDDENSYLEREQHDDSNEVEVIDQYEIFGESRRHICMQTTFDVFSRPY